jgi:hypothetical protein
MNTNFTTRLLIQFPGHLMNSALSLLVHPQTEKFQSLSTRVIPGKPQSRVLFAISFDYHSNDLAMFANCTSSGYAQIFRMIPWAVTPSPGHLTMLSVHSQLTDLSLVDSLPDLVTTIQDSGILTKETDGRRSKLRALLTQVRYNRIPISIQFS